MFDYDLYENTISNCQIQLNIKNVDQVRSQSGMLTIERLESQII